MLMSKMLQQLIFWGVWIIIPFIWEIFIGILSAVMVLMRHDKKGKADIGFYPKVTILIPACNAEKTIEKCLYSVLNQTYPTDKLEVFVIGNGSKDCTFDIFSRFQEANTQLNIWWYHSPKGKSKALNKGIFGSTAKYIIHIDSDGWLDKDAVLNVVQKFERDEKISCMTGVVLTDPGTIGGTKSRMMRLIQQCEFFEYTEAFLIGRNFHSMTNTMFTISGAFSCFRREAIMRTQLYNSETIGEDTHMTFQIRNFVGGKIILCEDAYIYVDPIESFDRLYIQRQRWQRGELEVASLFSQLSTGSVLDYFKKFAMRIIVSDHTLAFPRMIWFFAVIYLFFINYPLQLLIGANVLLYVIYMLNSFMYTGVAFLYLADQPISRAFIRKNWAVCFLLPLYRFFTYWIRLAGVINSLTTESKWHMPTLTEEASTMKNSVTDTVNSRMPFMNKIDKFFNS